MRVVIDPPHLTETTTLLTRSAADLSVTHASVADLLSAIDRRADADAVGALLTRARSTVERLTIDHRTRIGIARDLDTRTWRAVSNGAGDGRRARQQHLPRPATEHPAPANTSPAMLGPSEFNPYVHLVDDTRGEPPHWNRDEIRELSIHAVPASGGGLRLLGNFHLETKDGKRGYMGQLEGRLDFDPKSNTISRFDLVAIGDHWGEGRFTGGARPGKSPLGVAFTLGDPKKAADRIPPQGIRWEDGYYRAEVH